MSELLQSKSVTEVRVACDSAVSPPRNDVVYISVKGRQDALGIVQGTVGDNLCMG